LFVFGAELLPAAAISQQTVDGLQAALEIGSRSSYVLNEPIGVRSPVFRRCAPEHRTPQARLEFPLWMKL